MHQPARDDKVATARREFADRFQCEPSHVVWAPGRVNLIGEHTDYNDGFVLPMATEVGILLVARPRPDRTVRVWSRLMGEWFEPRSTNRSQRPHPPGPCMSAGCWPP